MGELWAASGVYPSLVMRGPSSCFLLLSYIAPSFMMGILVWRDGKEAEHVTKAVGARSGATFVFLEHRFLALPCTL